MTPSVPFYFLRHGATDPHIDDAHIPLNVLGIEQATARRPLIQSLPIKTVCVSPLGRAQETACLVTEGLAVPHHTVAELAECTHHVWHHMTGGAPHDGHTKDFFTRVRHGLKRALMHPGPVLIVAHGGVYYALCQILGVQGHSGLIDHCIPVTFVPCPETGSWAAAPL